MPLRDPGIPNEPPWYPKVNPFVIGVSTQQAVVSFSHPRLPQRPLHSRLTNAANGLEMDEFSDFYAGVGYAPVVDPGADAQTFRESSGSGLLVDRTVANAPTTLATTSPSANGMEKDAFESFHADVGYRPVADTGADAQTFTPASDLCQPSPLKEKTSVPAGEIAANGLPKGVYESFHAGLGYASVTDVGADAQKFAPAEVLEDHS